MPPPKQAKRLGPVHKMPGELAKGSRANRLRLYSLIGCRAMRVARALPGIKTPSPQSWSYLWNGVST